jgi:hypothetical protein
MLKYFLDDREVTETDAATAWFERAENHGIDVSKAIGIWEDASEATGENSRRIVGQSGIRVEFREK